MDPEHLAVAGCTAVTRSYLGYARVLAESWAQVHRGAPFSVLVLDGSDSDLDVVAPEHLGLNPMELQLLRGMYDPTELATGLKPHLLARLLDRGADAVIFLDPDMYVYAPLDDIGRAAAENGVVLSPHVLAPMPADGCSPTERETMFTGAFNGGLVAVGRSARPFLDWWAARLARDCLVRFEEGLYVDQRLLDWVPVYFPQHVILRDPSVNVAWWNLHERPLTMNDAGYEVGGAPLRLFHFSGFDPMRPQVLTTYELVMGHPFRIRMERMPPLQRLCADYAARVRSAGHAGVRHIPYGYARTASGRRLGKWERAIFRDAVLHAERTGRPAPPSPFDPDQEDDFEALIDSARDRATLPLRVRARLEQLRVRVSDRPRQPPASPAGRAMFRGLRALRRRVDRWGPVLMDLLPTGQGPSAGAKAGRASDALPAERTSRPEDD